MSKKNVVSLSFVSILVVLLFMISVVAGEGKTAAEQTMRTQESLRYRENPTEPAQNSGSIRAGSRDSLTIQPLSQPPAVSEPRPIGGGQNQGGEDEDDIFSKALDKALEETLSSSIKDFLGGGGNGQVNLPFSNEASEKMNKQLSEMKCTSEFEHGDDEKYKGNEKTSHGCGVNSDQLQIKCELCNHRNDDNVCELKEKDGTKKAKSGDYGNACGTDCCQQLYGFDRKTAMTPENNANDKKVTCDGEKDCCKTKWGPWDTKLQQTNSECTAKYIACKDETCKGAVKASCSGICTGLQARCQQDELDCQIDASKAKTKYAKKPGAESIPDNELNDCYASDMKSVDVNALTQAQASKVFTLANKIRFIAEDERTKGDPDIAAKLALTPPCTGENFEAAKQGFDLLAKPITCKDKTGKTYSGKKVQPPFKQVSNTQYASGLVLLGISKELFNAIVKEETATNKQLRALVSGRRAQDGKFGYDQCRVDMVVTYAQDSSAAGRRPQGSSPESQLGEAQGGAQPPPSGGQSPPSGGQGPPSGGQGGGFLDKVLDSAAGTLGQQLVAEAFKEEPEEKPQFVAPDTRGLQGSQEPAESLTSAEQTVRGKTSATCESEGGAQCPKAQCPTILPISKGVLQPVSGTTVCCLAGLCLSEDKNAIVQQVDAATDIAARGPSNRATGAAVITGAATYRTATTLTMGTPPIVKSITGGAEQNLWNLGTSDVDDVRSDYDNIYIIHKNNLMFTLYGAGNKGVTNKGDYFKIDKAGDTQVSNALSRRYPIETKDRFLVLSPGTTNYYGAGREFITNTRVFDTRSRLEVEPPTYGIITNPITGAAIDEPSYTKVSFSYNKRTLPRGENAVDISWNGYEYDMKTRGSFDMKISSDGKGIFPMFSRGGKVKGDSLIVANPEMTMSERYDLKDDGYEYAVVPEDTVARVKSKANNKIIQDTGNLQLRKITKNQKLLVYQRK